MCKYFALPKQKSFVNDIQRNLKDKTFIVVAFFNHSIILPEFYGIHIIYYNFKNLYKNCPT